MPAYEFLDHPADVGFVARGRTLAQLFAHAARAMLDYGWDLSTVRARKKVRVSVAGHDLESLLYNWLAEILSRADAENWIFKTVTVNRVTAQGTRHKVQGTEYQVQGTAAGEPFLRARHRARTYIKAVTYHQLAVQQTPGGFEATVFLDV
ncbi:MAG: archease [Terriglobia bacterium]